MSGPINDRDAWGNALSQVANVRFRNLVQQHGYSKDHAERVIIRDFLACAASVFCRRAILKGHQPDPKVWRRAAKKAFLDAAQRAGAPSPPARRVLSQPHTTPSQEA